MSDSTAASTSASAAEYRLIYFNGRGLAEIPRMIFTIAKVDYVDERYSFRRDPDGTVHRPEWEANKDNAQLFPFAKMPVLVTRDGTSIPQSRAIERFLARKFGLFGGNELEGALIDSVLEQLTDLRKAYQEAKWKKDEGVALKSFFDKDFLPFLTFFENWLNRRPSGASSTPFFVGDKFSLADLSIYYLLWVLENGNELERQGVADALKHTPKLQLVKDTVAKIPELASYVAKRAVTPF